MLKMLPKEDTLSDPKIRIINSALEEFTLKGFFGARTNQIAKNAKVNKAMIYYYFNSKEELYKRSLEYIFESKNNQPMLELLSHELNNNIEKFCFVIHMIVKIHFQYYDRTMKKLLHWQQVEDNSHVLYALVEKFIHPQFEKIKEIVTDGIKGKEFKKMNPSVPIYLMLNSIVHYHEMETFFEGSVLYKDLYFGNKMEKMEKMKNVLIDFILMPMLRDSEDIKHCNKKKIENLVKKFDDMMINKIK